MERKSARFSRKRRKILFYVLSFDAKMFEKFGKEKFVKMKIKIYLALPVLGCLSLWLISDAANSPLIVTAEAQTKTSCDISTYISEDDPNGTNIRAKPNKNSAILKTLKSESDIGIEITGYSNGWFEISGAQEVGDSDKVLFQGRGWIHSSLVGLDVAGADPRLYAEPRKRSSILMKLKPDESRLTLLACQGEWVKVQTSGKIGWLSPDGQCGNPLTTCP
jgi:SH3-like domain-containing protein